MHDFSIVEGGEEGQVTISPLGCGSIRFIFFCNHFSVIDIFFCNFSYLHVCFLAFFNIPVIVLNANYFKSIEEKGGLKRCMLLDCKNFQDKERNILVVL